MKALKTIALLLTIVVSAVTLLLTVPQFTSAFPQVKSAVGKVRATIGLTPAPAQAGHIVVKQITPGPTLTPAQAHYLEQHRRRYQLLRAALVE